jgi:hypothetical protein
MLFGGMMIGKADLVPLMAASGRSRISYIQRSCSRVISSTACDIRAAPAS